MDAMREIEVKQLTEEGFRKYGLYQNLLDDESLAQNAVFPRTFFADVLGPLDFGNGNLPTVSVCQVEKKEEKRIDFIEFHEHTCEGILPLDGDVILFVGTPGIYGLTPEHIEAFYVPRGTFVKMNPLIVHGNQFSTSENTVHSMCLLAGRTFHNDMHVKQLSEEEKILIK
ncbi:hypothetical protein DWY96_04880 [Roseburia inulinivorans]|jgi:ureidoglycolate hydrolase|uniref:Ureidoglycolate hydrolase n=2 Tax=Roseburia inulinivorans TaxID=360807 RepID=A0A412BDJ2_9FIRM|nr:hypothetical protein DWY96_04880 [Roseburia inulinivorans]